MCLRKAHKFYHLDLIEILWTEIRRDGQDRRNLPEVVNKSEVKQKLNWKKLNCNLLGVEAKSQEDVPSFCLKYQRLKLFIKAAERSEIYKMTLKQSRGISQFNQLCLRRLLFIHSACILPKRIR